MQVLGWQCHMLQKHGLSYEDIDVNLNTNDTDRVTPDTLEEMTPIAATPGDGGGSVGDDECPPEAGVVLAGFRDCSEEAIRYLVEVEHMQEDDPLVVGLKKHLWERQQYLDVERLLEEQGCRWGYDEVVGEGYHHHNYQQQQQHQQHHQEHQHNIWDSHSQQQHITEAAQWRLQQGAADTTLTNSSDTSHHLVDSCSTTTPTSPHKHSSQENQEQETRPDLSVLDIALLSQNNPAIASLTEEILSLLGAESDSDLDDSDIENMDHYSD